MLKSALLSKQALGIFVIGALACFAIFNFLITPATEDRDEAEAQLETLELRAATLQNELSDLQTGDSNTSEDAFNTAVQLENILQPGAGTDQRPFLLGYMPTLAMQQGLAETPAPFTSPTEGPGGLSYIDYSYSITGSLPQTMAFLDQVHALPLLATVDSFSTTFAAGESGNEWSSQVEVRVWWSEMEPVPGFDPADLSSFTAAPPAPEPEETDESEEEAGEEPAGEDDAAGETTGEEEPVDEEPATGEEEPASEEPAGEDPAAGEEEPAGEAGTGDDASAVDDEANSGSLTTAL